MKRVKKLLKESAVILLGVSLLNSCGDIKELPKEIPDEIVDNGGGGDQPEPEPETNPIVNGVQYFGNDGNLWKPEGDGGGPLYSGNVVVLFSSKFKKQFNECVANLKNGQSYNLTCVDDQPWTQTPYSCFSNGNRQTWRAKLSCDKFRNATITCKDSNQEITFKAKNNNRRACNRHG